jgi:hypothetical protein
MRTVEKLLEEYKRGKYDDRLKDFYGRDQLEYQKRRYEFSIGFFGATYGWDRKINIYTVPYSVILAGDGCDVAIPTDLDALMLVADNGTNVSRTRFRSFIGEDNIDTYQAGPYTSEYGIVTGLVRGIQQAFRHFNYGTYGIDMYMDCDTLPGIGLDEAAHMATAIGCVYNDIFNDNKLSPAQIARAVQWALANYMLCDSTATDIYSSIEGKAVLGDFTNQENPTVKPINADMDGKSMYVIKIGDNLHDIDESEVDSRIDGLLKELGIEIEKTDEKEFYSKLAEAENVDIGALLYVLDYYTQENFGKIYEVNSDDGIGSPTVEKSVEPIGETVGGAIKYHSKVNEPYFLELLCVGDESESEFLKAIEKIWGKGSAIKLSFAKRPATKLIDALGKSVNQPVYYIE